jgi:DNA invertase Pin-like site-specific DNA recombinase
VQLNEQQSDSSFSSCAANCSNNGRRSTAMTYTDSEPLQHPKITPIHHERLAYIYVRQSSPKQVAHNRESQDYQYRLQQRAIALGWPADRVRVIDSDLGRSGREASARSGFQDIVADISLGQVGIVFGYEVSRLARNNRDWYLLLDLAAVFGTLIADNDGVYDPRLYNDRLLLGLKGTMSEAELHLLRQRLDAGRMNQIKRGAYRQHLPAGYLRLPDGTVVKDPDDQVRHVLELVFAQFAQLGSINKVMRSLRKHTILLPRRPHAGPHAHELVWHVASEAALTQILTNPAYAGVFAYGRRQTDPSLQQAGRPATGRRRKPISEWLHLQQDVYPAYISWEQYLANQEQLHQNGLHFAERRAQAQGVVREGPGVLQGLVVCGRCGHHMHTVYKTTPRYLCRGLARTTAAVSDCTSVRAPTVDALVVAAFFTAIQPAQLDGLDAILEAGRAEHTQLEQVWHDQLKRARYEAHLAQRQYDTVDPANRLVAAELERRWETALQHLRQTEERYAQFQQTPVPEVVPSELRERFRDISQQLPEMWPTLTNGQQKNLLRSLIQQVIIRRPAPDQVSVRIVWVSGCYSDHTNRTPIHRDRDVSRYDQLVARLHELWREGYNDTQIAEQLTREGYHSARSAYVTRKSVRKIRLARKWYLPFERFRNAEVVGEDFTVNGLAKRLAVKESRIYSLIERKIIPAEAITHEPHSGIYLIRNDAALIERLLEYIAAQKGRNGRLKVTPQT